MDVPAIGSRALTALCALVMLVLVVVASTSDLPIALGAVGVGAAVSLVVTLGPERFGLGLLLTATLLAPMNRLRIGDSGNVTFADLAYLGAFVLLAPRMLRPTKKLPKLYAIGITILVLNALVVSLLAPSPVLSLVAFAKVAWAVIVIPVVILRLNPERRLLLALAWSFVAGQLRSFACSVTHHTGDVGGGRALGYTTHPGFFGLAGQMAVCLCIFLFYEVDRRFRWMVVGALGLSMASVFVSGARASLLCVAVTFVLWPVVERTAMSMYAMLSAGAVILATANVVLANAPRGSALARLQGEGSASGSDLARKLALEDGLHRFWQAPLRGNGFNDILQIHNVYVEVAVGGGILALAGFLFVLAGLVAPLFRPGVPNRLGYLGVSYAAFAMIGPTLYDRVLWAALALAVAGHDFSSAPPPGDPAPTTSGERDAPIPRRSS